MSRNFSIALLISLGIHVFCMSVVAITNPAARQKMKAYSRVDFLGPLLQKTAFDIMLENADPIVETTYRDILSDSWAGYLRAAPPERHTGPGDKFSDYFMEERPDTGIEGSLYDDKSTPDFLLRSRTSIKSERYGADSAKRVVLYRPAAPVLVPGVYGDADVFYVKTKALVSSDGTVKSVEPLTTTGYPGLDFIVAKHVGGWIFEPIKNAENDRWEEVDVVLRTGGESL